MCNRWFCITDYVYLITGRLCAGTPHDRQQFLLAVVCCTTSHVVLWLYHIEQWVKIAKSKAFRIVPQQGTFGRDAGQQFVGTAKPTVPGSGFVGT
jgi:hypothetical protein